MDFKVCKKNKQIKKEVFIVVLKEKVYKKIGIVLDKSEVVIDEVQSNEDIQVENNEIDINALLKIY